MLTEETRCYMSSGLKRLHFYKRIVVKIGSALLVDRDYGLKSQWLASLIADIAQLRKKNVDVLLVSSGAIALGRTLQQLPCGPLKLEQAQACAAIGQIELAKAYGEALDRHDLKTGQILLTLNDTEERRHYLNARATMNTLLEFGVVPLINENDTVATSEIRYGDNDRLAARVATMMGADLLVLLSDIDGLYTAPPHLDPKAQFVPYISTIDDNIEAMAGVAASEFSKGGMKTKLDAGVIATLSGTAMVITSGKRMSPLSAIDKGEKASFFAPSLKPVSAWKTWISGHLEASGHIVIDQGALIALKSGKSLLSAGVLRVEGDFQRGDTVSIRDETGNEIARGLISYDACEAIKITGLKSSEIADVLGYEPRSAMIHRNDMVLRD